MKKLWIQNPRPGCRQMTLGTLRNMVAMLEADGADEDTLIYTTRIWRKGCRPVPDLVAYSYRIADPEDDTGKETDR